MQYLSRAFDIVILTNIKLNY